MKKFLLIVFGILFLNFAGQAQFTLASDDASLYGGTWTNGDNYGTGFNAWNITYGTSAGTFVGEPSSDGMGTTGIGTTALGLYSTSTAYLNAYRGFSGLEFGDSFSFYWAMNYDAGGGSKGFDLKSSGSTIFNVNNTGSATITTSNGTADANYGTDAMLVTVTRTSDSEYGFTMTSRSGGSTYSTTISSSSSIDQLHIYTGNQNDGAGQKNIYFNLFKITNSGNFNITSGSETYTKALSGSANLTKSGAGTLILTGASTYTGTTTVSAGTLKLEGSLANSDVTVENGATLVLNGSASTVKSLTINSGGTVTVNAGKALTVSGNLTNNGTLTVASDANGNGSLIVSGTPSGNVTVQRYVQGYNDGAANGWHLVGLPVDATISGSSFDPTSTSNDLYSWDEPNYIWYNYQQGHFSTFSRGTGYLMAQQSNTTNSITGTLSNSNVDLSNLSYNASSGGGYGWHLLGNPFTSALTWNDGSENWALTNVGGVAKVWNESAGTYSDISADGVIPATTGFFVQVGSTSNSLTIPAADQIHDATNNYKSTAAQQETLKFKVTGEANTYYDDNTFGFKSNATDNYDFAFDSHKLFSMVNTAPQLWTVIDGQNYSTNFMAANEESKTVPLDFKAGVNSTYHLSWAGMDNMDPNLQFILEDKLTGTTVNMRDYSQYDFTASTDDSNDRFVLHINGANGIPQTNADNPALIYSYGHSIYIKAKNNQVLNGKVILNNLLGQVIYSTNLNGTSQQTLRTNLNTGVYIVRMELNDGSVLAQKVVIK